MMFRIRSSSQDQKDDPGVILYEISKFSNLLVKGNPNLLELFIAIEEKSNLLSEVQLSEAWIRLQQSYRMYITEKVLILYRFERISLLSFSFLFFSSSFFFLSFLGYVLVSWWHQSQA